VSFLAEAIESVKQQTCRDIELIVVDDGSTDGTAALLAEQAATARHVRLAHSGMPERARNAGLAAAQGELVAFLDDDDVWHPAKLERQAAVLDANPGAGYAYCDLRVLHPDGALSGPRLEARHKRPARVFEHLLSGWSIYPSCLMIRRAWLVRLGSIDEQPSSQGDFVYLLRLAHAAPAAIAPEPLVHIRQHAKNLSRQRELLDVQHMIDILSRLPDRLPLTPRQRRLTRVQVARLECHLGLAQMRARDTAGARRHLLASVRANPLQRRAWGALARAVARPR
jgi:glycosyltransferase involved in cell wall biosynthesis